MVNAKTLERPCTLQFRHNNSDDFVAGYAKDEMDTYVSHLEDIIVEQADTIHRLRVAIIDLSRRLDRANHDAMCRRY